MDDCEFKLDEEHGVKMSIHQTGNVGYVSDLCSCLNMNTGEVVRLMGSGGIDDQDTITLNDIKYCSSERISYLSLLAKAGSE